MAEGKDWSRVGKRQHCLRYQDKRSRRRPLSRQIKLLDTDMLREAVKRTGDKILDKTLARLGYALEFVP